MSRFDQLLDSLELLIQSNFALADHIGELRESIDRLPLQDRSSIGVAVNVARME